MMHYAALMDDYAGDLSVAIGAKPDAPTSPNTTAMLQILATHR